MQDTALTLTVSGPPGSGTTTLAKELADEYNLLRLTGGDIFRDMAAEHGMSEKEFGPYVNERPELDREIDERLYAAMQAASGTSPADTEHETAAADAVAQLDDRNGLIVESRLAGWLGGERADFRLWCTAPLKVRTARLQSDRDGRSAETEAELRQREQDETLRYENFYGVDVSDLSIYDLVVNTARWTPDTVFDIVTSGIDQHVSDADEGHVGSRDPIASTTVKDADPVEQ